MVDALDERIDVRDEAVALQCGFSSIAAFERSYRKYFGCPPAERAPSPLKPDRS